MTTTTGTTTMTTTTTTMTTNVMTMTQPPQLPQRNNEKKETHLCSPELV